MREDMDKVIVERPRLGSRQKHRKGSLRQWQQMPPEEWPKREGIYAHKGRTKWFNEHLGPLRRYLRKQVGRPWNKVFAEICENLRCDSVVQSHVRDHVGDIVAIQVTEMNGSLFYRSRWGSTLPLEPRWMLQLYVCPRTGILRVIQRSRNRAAVTRVCVDESLQFHLLTDRWFEVRLRKIPADFEHCVDAVSEMLVSRCRPGELAKRYGLPAYALSKRPLNGEELRALKKRIVSLPR
jgi:hypothetical protein